MKTETAWAVVAPDGKIFEVSKQGNGWTEDELRLIQIIDSEPYDQLLRRWRFASIGDQFFQGRAGKYYKERMAELRSTTPRSEQIAASKRIGW